MFDDDIVRDILRRACEAASREGGFNDRIAEQIERQVRRDWGGSEPYIARDLEGARQERNARIQQMFDDGHRDLVTLATRFGLSVKQVRRIVGR